MPLARSCVFTVMVALLATGCSHDNASSATGSAVSPGSASAPVAVATKPLPQRRWYAEHRADGLCNATPDPRCAAGDPNCKPSPPLTLDCPHDTPDVFEVVEFDPGKCMIDPGRTEIPCPTSKPPALETWYVLREGKACYFSQYTRAAGRAIMAEIDCPPDNAAVIKEISPGVCQTAPDEREGHAPDGSKFTPKSVPCPPRA